MKRLALVAAVFAVAACAKKDENATPAADTSAAMPAAPAATPAATDTSMKMDTMSKKMDTMSKEMDTMSKAMKKKS